MELADMYVKKENEAGLAKKELAECQFEKQDLQY